jgi:acetolactate synthase I/II/III large subunit
MVAGTIWWLSQTNARTPHPNAEHAAAVTEVATPSTAGETGRLELSGGEALARMLRAFGAGPIFGMGGFQLLPFYGAIQSEGLEHYLVNDERCGGFMADGFARTSGRVGVCDGTLGPGATNLVTALVEARNAGIPMLAIVGDTERRHAGKGMTQEARQQLLLEPACKAFLRIDVAERIPELVRRAFSIATCGRPGPVVLDVPEDISHGVSAYDPVEFAEVDGAATPRWRSRPDPGGASAACDLLRRSRRPLILAGGGVHLSQAYDALEAFASAFDIPVAHTMSGKGAVPCVHPLSVGVFGRYSRIANDLISRSDCLLAIGTKLGEIATQRFSLLPDGVPLIQIDISPEDIGVSSNITVGLVGDARLAIADLHEQLAPHRDEIRAQLAAYRAEVNQRLSRWLNDVTPRLTSGERPTSVARLVHELNRVMPPEGVLVADGGFASHWTGLLYDTKRSGRHFVADRGFASIGYGLPAGIGARLGAPSDAPVVALTGDGGLNMALGELETAVRIGLPLTVIVVNNAASGYVKALQHDMLDGRYQSSDLTLLDYAAVARQVGWEGIRVDDPVRLAEVLRGVILAPSRPTLIDVRVTRDPSKMLPGVDQRVLTRQTVGPAR